MITLKNNLALNATNLKILAMVLMVFDHVHQMFEPVGAPIWLTWLGRPVMVMFLFAMSESFHYTGSRKKFLLRLLFASWFMTIFSFLMEAAILPNDNVVLMNNAFQAFFVAGLYMLFCDMLRDGVKERKAGKIIGSILLFFVPVLTVVPSFIIMGAGSGFININIDSLSDGAFQALMMGISLLPNVLFLEGGPTMVIMGVLFYLFRERRIVQIIVLAAFSVLAFVINRDAANQWLMIFAAIPMLLYNGEKGRGMKYFFYIFYPAHIYLLYTIATLAA